MKRGGEVKESEILHEAMSELFDLKGMLMLFSGKIEMRDKTQEAAYIKSHPEEAVKMSLDAFDDIEKVYQKYLKYEKTIGKVGKTYVPNVPDVVQTKDGVSVNRKSDENKGHIFYDENGNGFKCMGYNAKLDDCVFLNLQTNKEVVGCVKGFYYNNPKDEKTMALGGEVEAIFQEKSKNGSFIGEKIYYYKTKNPDWWFVSVGKPHVGVVPEYGQGTGQFKNKKQYPTIASLEEYHKGDNIYRINTEPKEKNFLVKDKSGRSAKPYIFPESHIIKTWDLTETDDDGETSLGEFINESETGDIWRTNSVSIENIGTVEKSENKMYNGGMVLSNKEIIKVINFEDNTDIRQGRYDFSFSTQDNEGAEILDYDGYIIEAPSSSRRNDEIEWGQNTPEDFETAEKILLDSFYEWKKTKSKMSAGGEIKKDFYIEYLNKKKNFQPDREYFKSFEDAEKWGRKNLGNFNIDMIRSNR